MCYALGITAVDSVRHGLVFERFLSPVRDGPPDIDVDIEASRRELVIQHVYEKYGRDRAAQVCNVITYRGRMALRDSARVLGYSPGTIDAWAGRIGPYEQLSVVAGAEAVSRPDSDPVSGPGSATATAAGTGTVSAQAPAPPPDPEAVPAQVLELARQLERRPRHLGIHSGGMVIVDRPLSQVVPIEWATMADRTVLQWDKDDCAAAGLVKFDLLGLGMLGALHDSFDLIREHHGRDLGLHSVPQDGDAEADEVYAMIQDADTVGVFQIESRAQMSTLPRLRPKEFYDLVVEVALIRPGPIQGGAVHPYLRRRNGLEEVTYPHPSLEPVLARTMGVVLFQEQAMQMAIHAAGFTATEADRLRQAMGSKRSPERMAELRGRLMAGMAERDIPPDVAEDIYVKLHAFSGYGFPESHSVSMAYIVWCSSFVKRYYPAAFTAALLNNQPMGFYSPASLVDRRPAARRADQAGRREPVGRQGHAADPGQALPAAPPLRLADPAAGRPPGPVQRPGPRRRRGRADRRGATPRQALHRTWRTSSCGPVCPARHWRPWRPRAPSPASASGAARRCGRPGRWPAPAATTCRAPRRATAAPYLDPLTPVGDDAGRPVGDRYHPGRPPDRPPASAPGAARGHPGGRAPQRPPS